MGTKPNREGRNAGDDGAFWRKMTLPVEDCPVVRVLVDDRGQPRVAAIVGFDLRNLLALEHVRNHGGIDV